MTAPLLQTAWTIARRELRGGLTGFRVLLLSLTLGVGAIAGVGSIGSAVQAGLSKEAARLLGGDIALSQRHLPASTPHLDYLRDHAAAFSAAIEMRAMAKPVSGADHRALIELKGVDSAYPLVGAVSLNQPAPLRKVLANTDGLWGAAVDPVLLGKLGVEIGDNVQVGDATFQIRAVVQTEPDRVASVISFGPRFMVATDAIAATGLVQPGSQIRYRYRLTLPAGTTASDWKANLEKAFPEASWRVRDTSDATPGLKRFLDRLALFLSFVGLTALLVGGVGVTNAASGYLDRKTATIAALKCIGATGRVIVLAYFLQILVLASLGIVAGVALGALATYAGALALGPLLPVQPVAAFYPEPLMIAAAFGLMVTVTFSLWPLGRAKEIPPAILFRDKVAPAGLRPSPRFLTAAAGSAVLLALLTFFSASDKGFALWFIGGSILTLALLKGGAALMVRLAKRANGTGSAALRLAIANIHRPGAATAAVVLSLGIGLSVLVALAEVQANLAHQVEERLPDAAPAFFFIDIQPDQVDAFEKTVLAIPGTSDLQRMPSLRGRIVAIDGTPIEDVTVPHGAQWAVQGDRALTYAAKPFDHAKLVAGAWWDEDYSGPPQISFDAGLAKAFGVGVGDTLTLNVLGREITATIGSLREIDWRSLRFDFAIIFAPGPLNGAPHTHIAAIQAPPEQEGAIEKAVTDGFGNISAIRVRDALDAAATILAGIGQAVQGTAALAVLAGILVLGGAIAAGAERRVRDAVVFKVLGATRIQVLRAFLIEFSIVGFGTGVIGAVIGTLTGWAVVAFLLRMDWTFYPGIAALAVGACLSLTLLAGFAGTWHALGRKAATYLRNE